MRFNVAALAQAAQQAIAADRQRWDKAAAEEEDKRDAAANAWVVANREAWISALAAARRKLSRGHALTFSDFPKNQYGRLDLHDPPSRHRMEYRAPVELLALAKVLETVADETVTSSGLRELGITGSALRACTTWLARNTVTAGGQ